MYTTRRGGFDREDARLHYEQLQQRKYVLNLYAGEGTAVLHYSSMNEALQMQNAFMNTGNYYDAKIEVLS